MTIAYWCVFIFMLFPWLTVAIAKAMGKSTMKDNHNPREYFEKQEGMVKRLYNAHLNAIEMFAPFAAAVIIASLVGQISQSIINHLAIAFLLTRIIYIVCYAMDWALFRSIVWMLGLFIVISLYLLPLLY